MSITMYKCIPPCPPPYRKLISIIISVYCVYIIHYICGTTLGSCLQFCHLSSRSILNLNFSSSSSSLHHSFTRLKILAILFVTPTPVQFMQALMYHIWCLALYFYSAQLQSGATSFKITFIIGVHNHNIADDSM